MSDEIVDLYVDLCSDGSILSYKADRTLSNIFSDLSSWSKLKAIHECTQWSSLQRKKKGELNIKYVKYYFKNVQTDDRIPIPNEHIIHIIRNLKEVL